MKSFALILFLVASISQAQVIGITSFKTRKPAASYVQVAENYLSSSSTTLTTAAFAAAPTTGNLIVCALGWDKNFNVSSVADTNSNTYTLATTGTLGSCDGTQKYAIYYKENVTGGGSNVKVKATFSGSATVGYLTCHEFSGMVQSGSLDVAGFYTQASAVTSLSLGPAANSYTKELVFTYVGSFQTFNPTNGFNVVSTINGNSAQYKIVTPPGAVALTGTFLPSSCADMPYAIFKSR